MVDFNITPEMWARIGGAVPAQQSMGGSTTGNILGGVLSGLGTYGRLVGGQQAQQQQQALRNIQLARQGIDPARAQDPAYLSQVAQRFGRPQSPLAGAGEFGRLLSFQQTPEFQQLDPQQQQLLGGRLEYLTQSPANIYARELAKTQAGLTGEIGLKPVLERQTTLAEQQAKREVEGEKALAEATRSFQAADVEINKIEDILREDPEVTGAYSAPQAALSRYTGGQIGFTPEQMQRRGELERRLNKLGTTLIGMATAAGQSGINVQAEVERITRGITSQSTPEELKGAMGALREQLQVLRDIRAGQNGTPEIRGVTTPARQAQPAANVIDFGDL